MACRSPRDGDLLSMPSLPVTPGENQDLLFAGQTTRVVGMRTDVRHSISRLRTSGFHQDPGSGRQYSVKMPNRVVAGP